MEIIYDEDVEATPAWDALYTRLDSRQLYKQDQSNDIKMSCKEGKLTARREQPPSLKKLIKKNKVNRLVANFSRKVKRNLCNSEAVELNVNVDGFDSFFKSWLIQTEGIELSQLQLTLLTLFSIGLIGVLSVSYSLALVFPEVKQGGFISGVQWVGLCFFGVQIALNFWTKTYVEGRSLTKLNEIGVNYLKGRFFIDSLSYLILMIDCIVQSEEASWLAYARLIIIFKLSQNLQRLQIIENYLIINYSRQQYWGLLNVFIANFVFAHLLSLLLNSMAAINQKKNWLTEHSLQNEVWYVKYIWGYYWGTTIMLTVGFGDFVATNEFEAICLIFIEMISCISLSYNINCVGGLISNLRSQSEEKNKNLKTFNLMSKSSNLSIELQTRINHYIEGSFLIRKQFNFSSQDTVLEFLPANLRIQYLRQANRAIIRGLCIIKDFTQKSRNSLAQNLIRVITHPEEVIQKKGQNGKFIILQQGEIGYCVKWPNSQIEGRCLQYLRIDKEKHARLLSMNFLKGKQLCYTMKSLSFCILYRLQNQDLITILRENSFDYQHFCMVRDREEYIMNELELDECKYCRGDYHTVFTCPRLHYNPLKQQVIHRENRRSKNNVQMRRKYIRTKPRIIYNHLYLKEKADEFKSQTQIQNTSLNLNPTVSQIFLNMFKGEQQESHSNSHNSSLSSNSAVNSLRGLQDRRQMIHNRDSMVDLLRALISQQRNDFWLVESDMLHNWKYYFPQDNSENLQDRIKKKKRKTTFV